MINQTPPTIMTTEERLDEIAELMMRGVLRLKKRKEQLGRKMSMGEYIIRLGKEDR